MWANPLAVALVLAVSCCAKPTSVHRAPLLAGMIGVSEADVVRQFGPPTRSFDQGQLRTLVYNRTDTERLQFAPRGYSRPVVADFACSIAFVLEAGRVRSFDQRGSGC
jgi:hypothetical protein